MQEDGGTTEPASAIDAGAEQGSSHTPTLDCRVNPEHADGCLVVFEHLGPRRGGIRNEGHAAKQPIVHRDQHLGCKGPAAHVGQLLA
jgi:hypothetical protein